MRTLTASQPKGGPAPEPRSFLFLVLDAQRLTAPVTRFALAGLTRVVVGRGDPGFMRSAEALDIRIPDVYVSTMHFRLERDPDGEDDDDSDGWTLVDTSKNGTSVNGARAARTQLGDGDIIEAGSTFFRFRAGVEAGPDDGDLATANLRPGADGLATLLPGLGQTFRQLERLARSDVSVLLHGETGTGKEVLARAIHACSRRKGAFVAVNCGAIPDNLVESELFGHKKGAFSGAGEDRVGLVRSADEGTLLLDEIGDLPLGSQAALLRVLQEREVMPVGATRPVRVDLRVVAASHHDLAALVGEKKFRPDLEARLAGVVVDVPPLRERLEDLGLLIGAILQRVAPDLAGEVVLDLATARAFLAHPWSKNVRELEQVLTSGVALAGRLPIALVHLPKSFHAASAGPVAPVKAASAARPASPADTDLRKMLEEQLAATGGNISGVARALGKPRKQIQRWLKRFGLDAKTFKSET